VKSDEPEPTYAVQADRCHDRFCPACARERGSRYAHRITQKIGTARVRFLTLTLKHTDQPLSQQLARLQKCFAALRRTVLWSRSVKGGVAIFEVKLSTRNVQWHPHLHILFVGSYLPQKLVAQAWLAITTDSFIVDVRQAKSPGDVASYVTKYVTKPIHGDVYRAPGCLDEAIQAFQGRRLATTFGTWRGYALNEKPETPMAWIHIARLKDLLYRSRTGDKEATDLLRKITNAREFLMTVPDENLHFG
jgi:hypothetical protein